MNKFIIQLLDSDDNRNYILAHLLVKDWISEKEIGWGKDRRKYGLYVSGSKHKYIRDMGKSLPGWCFVRDGVSDTYNFFTHVPGTKAAYY